MTLYLINYSRLFSLWLTHMRFTWCFLISLGCLSSALLYSCLLQKEQTFDGGSVKFTYLVSAPKQGQFELNPGRKYSWSYHRTMLPTTSFATLSCLLFRNFEAWNSDSSGFRPWWLDVTYKRAVRTFYMHSLSLKFNNPQSPFVWLLNRLLSGGPGF